MRAPALMAAFIAIALGLPAHAADRPGVAFFGFSMINTSLEPTKPEEEARLRMLDNLLRETLASSGRFTLAEISPDLQVEIARGADIRDCNGCERDYAKRAGADWAAWGQVQKVSNLILDINLYMEDAQTGKLEFVKRVSIRGNTDESWRRGLEYMLRNYLLVDP
jgi:Protein of unknown function (DUF2380)